MCGRFALFTIDDLEKVYRITKPYDNEKFIQNSYNVAPGQTIRCVVQNDGQNEFRPMLWGLITEWGIKKHIQPINIRDDSLAQKGTFKHQLSHQRCVIPANGFFEWKKEGSQKVPYYFKETKRQVISFAGIWTSHTDEQGKETLSCAIITTAANSLVSKLHERMPVILDRESEDIWLDSRITDREQLIPLLKPYPSEKMVHYKVSKNVNKSNYNGNDTIAPEEDTLF
jgi:putative SOS response-associated peptidase YedK